MKNTKVIEKSNDSNSLILSNSSHVSHSSSKTKARHSKCQKDKKSEAQIKENDKENQKKILNLIIEEKRWL